MQNKRGLKDAEAVLAAFVMLLVSGCKCGRDDDTEHKVHFRRALEAEPKTIDWTVNDESVGIEIAYHLCEPLVWYHQTNLSPLPGSAEHWERKTLTDGTVEVTFFIGKDRKWSNGDPVTASDFVYAWQRLVNPRTGAKYQRIVTQFGLTGTDAYFAAEKPISDLSAAIEAVRNKLEEEKDDAVLSAKLGQEIKRLQNQKEQMLKALEPQLTALSGQLGFKAQDAQTFVVHVKSPGYADILMGLAGFPPLCPVHEPTIRAHGIKWTDPKNIVSNGPYRLVEHIKDGYYLLVKQPDWWNAHNVAIDYVTLDTTNDMNVVLQRYEEPDPQKMLQMTSSVPPDWIDKWRDKPDFRVAPMYGVYYVIFQTQKNPFDNAHTRRALCQAIDRQHIVEHVTRGKQRPISAFFPSLPDGTYHETLGLKFNPEQARAELRASGYTVAVQNGKVATQGFPLFTYAYNTNPGHEAVATALQTMWRTHLGITVQLSNMTWKAFTEMREQSKCEGCRGGWIGDYLHPLTMADLLRSNSSQNDSRWFSNAYDDLIDRAMKAEAAEAEQLFKMADQMIAQEAPVCPLYQYNTVRLVKPGVRGYTDNLRDYHPTWQLSLDAPELKQE